MTNQLRVEGVGRREYAGRPRYTEDEHRAALVRAVLAEQWTVACALLGERYDDGDWQCPRLALEFFGFELDHKRCAALPCAVDVVAERLGEVP